MRIFNCDVLLAAITAASFLYSKNGVHAFGGLRHTALSSVFSHVGRTSADVRCYGELVTDTNDVGVDCGCSENFTPLQSGKLSQRAQMMDHRQILSGTSLYDLRGNLRLTDDIICDGSDLDNNPTSIVVFLRSFG
mmetsp:Transcript_6559/g.14163  ORF Transcript_6559/g.14163 Transcript_6559/m.14163 type:complete len:135 (+) Transcript_6559:91-495(+)